LKGVGKKKMKSWGEQERRDDKNKRREGFVERGCSVEYVEEESFDLGMRFIY
jgi:hypothetical protein